MLSSTLQKPSQEGNRCAFVVFRDAFFNLQRVYFPFRFALELSEADLEETLQVLDKGRYSTLE